MIINAYDLMHRIAYNKPSNNETINKIIFKSFDALIHGARMSTNTFCSKQSNDVCVGANKLSLTSP